MLRDRQALAPCEKPTNRAHAEELARQPLAVKLAHEVIGDYDRIIVED